MEIFPFAFYVIYARKSLEFIEKLTLNQRNKKFFKTAIKIGYLLIILIAGVNILHFNEIYFLAFGVSLLLDLTLMNVYLAVRLQKQFETVLNDLNWGLVAWVLFNSFVFGANYWLMTINNEALSIPMWLLVLSGLSLFILFSIWNHFDTAKFFFDEKNNPEREELVALHNSIFNDH